MEKTHNTAKLHRTDLLYPRHTKYVLFLFILEREKTLSYNRINTVVNPIRKKINLCKTQKIWNIKNVIVLPLVFL